MLALAPISCSTSESPPTLERLEISTHTNVVLLIIDTLRADVLGCYGYAADTTPELDDYAAQGVRFDRVVANSTWTRPSIGTILTSLPGRTLGIYHEQGDMLDTRFETLPEILHAHGYTTIGVTANPNINSSFGFEQGFDRYEDSRRVYDWMPGGEDKAALLVRNRTAKEVFALAMDVIRQRRSPPYYVQLDIMEMHYPGPPLRDEYKGIFTMKVPWGQARYAAALRQVSVDIEAFVDELTSIPGMEDTLFVFVSDHGEGLSDHPSIPGSRTHGHVLYESNAIVPLIFYDTRHRLGGRTVKEKVQLLDVSPTILDVLGIPVPPQMEGHSLKSFITGQGRVPVLPKYYVTETMFGGSNKIGVYSDTWKYFENRDGTPGTDPREIQAKGTRENGSATNQIAVRGAEAARMADYLRSWEAAHPKAKPVRPAGGLTEEQTQQLRSLGYLK